MRDIKKHILNLNAILTGILVVNSFSWYFPLHIFLKALLYEISISYRSLLLIFGVYYVTILISAVFGVLIAQKISRHFLFFIWSILGTLSSLSLFFIVNGELLNAYPVSILVGISLGFGFPSCLAYFGDFTDITNRGKIGGVILSLSLIGMSIIGVLTMAILSKVGSIILFSLWRTVGLIFLMPRKQEKKREKGTFFTYRAIISDKNFILYLIPWISFCLVNFFVGPLQEYYWGAQTSNIVSIIEFGMASVSALVGGYLSDIIGRKRIIILGYILLGIGYALLSMLPGNKISIGIYALFDGIAWGIFALMFFAVIWGDLANKKEKEKHYLLGTLPFILSSYLSVIITPFAELISISASFSLASFFLFLAVVPLMYAPDTLPEKVIRERELKEYIEKAKKIREKYEKS